MKRMIVNQKDFKAALAQKGMRQWELAYRLGMSPSALTAYLTGRSRPPADLLRRIEEQLEIVTGSLQGGGDVD